ncbi:MAG: hypothetical protein IMZ54_11760 [Acidobacteria bacterium]|nr:hypothetical protein [Acidobacteriota bacterium]
MAGRQIRHGTNAQRIAVGGLSIGELGFETDTKNVYVGTATGDEIVTNTAFAALFAGQDQALKTTDSPIFAGATLRPKAPVVCMGDSMTEAVTYPARLQVLLGTTFRVINLGMGGEPAELMLSRFNREVISSGDVQYVVILAGVNSVNWGFSAATIEASLQAMYTAAHDAGIKVIAVTILPFKNYSTWSAGKQVVLEAVNTWITATATDIDYIYDAYPVFETPGGLDTLLAAYDSGDGLHPNAAGLTVLANGIYAAGTWTAAVNSQLIGTRFNQDVSAQGSPSFRSVNGLYQWEVGTNIGLGHYALGMITTATKSIGIGSFAGGRNTTGFVTAIGYEAALLSTTGNVVAVGTEAAWNNLTGDVVAVGYKAAYTNTSGVVTAVGYRAAYANTTGNVTAFGSEAAVKNTTGPYTTAIGYQAGYENLTGHITAVGYLAGRFNETGQITAVGIQAGYHNTTGDVCAVGQAAASTNTTGEVVAFGPMAGFKNTTGSLTCIGAWAGYGDVDTNAPVTDTFGLLIGYHANRSVASATALTNYIGIGYGTLIDKSHQVKIGNVNIVETVLGGVIIPFTDDAYYLGQKNTAWKGVRVKDTANGNYYSIIVTNGAIAVSAAL